MGHPDADNRYSRSKTRIFPVNSLLIREILGETGYLETASTATTFWPKPTEL